MKAADFVSAPEDLLPAALSHGAAFEDDGWKVSIEPYDLAYPRTPFFGSPGMNVGWLGRCVDLWSAFVG